MIYEELGKTGLKLSKLSLGGTVFGGPMLFGDYDTKEAEATIIEGINQGINYIDVAPHYGLGTAEKFLGKALKRIPRDSYYISTKVGRFGSKFNFTADGIIEGFEQSLERLDLKYVDIVIVHDVEFADSIDIIVNEALPAAEKLVKSKKAKFIGVSGYPLSTLLEVVSRSTVEIDYVLSYARDILIDDTFQDYIPKFKELGIGIINASCVAMGLLSNEGPQPWHPASKELKELCKSAGDFCKENGVELGRLALYHSFNQPGGSVCLVGMNNIDVLNTNLDVLKNGLSVKEKEVLHEIRKRFFTPSKRLNWEGVEVQLYKENKL